MAVRLPTTFEPKSAMSLSSLVTSIEYKTGAVYDGDVSDQAKEGTGVFTWPNGDCYSGQFSNDKRNGKGEQVWSDGDSYSGDYVDDLRHGHGEYRWSNGERYVGHFFKDHRHGPGQYFWADGSCFTGTFYMDRKEGYGQLLSANGDKFEGLYQADEREGPGVMTYADGSQDAGLWHRERLARLLTPISDTFSLADHPELQYDPRMAQLRLPIEGRPDPQLDEFLEKIVHPPDEWNYDHEASQRVESRMEEVLTGTRPDSAAFSCAEPDASFERTVGFVEPDAAAASSPSHPTESRTADESPHSPTKSSSKKSSPSRSPKRVSPTRRAGSKAAKKKAASHANDSPDQLTEQQQQQLRQQQLEESRTVAAWNPTPATIEMQLHTMRFKQLQSRCSFDVEAVLRGDRSSFNQPGRLEQRSVKLIESAKSGDLVVVKSLLAAGDLDPNVSDSRGKTPLLCASVGWHEAVINCLLDAGADVNRLSDEGTSSLSACFVKFFPADSFKQNIAESPVKRLTEEEQKAARKAAARAAAAAQKKQQQQQQQQKQQLSSLEESRLQQKQRRQGGAAAAADDLADPVVTAGRFAGTLTAGKRPDFAKVSSSWAASDEEEEEEEMEEEDGEGQGARGGRPAGGEEYHILDKAVSADASPRSSEDFESVDTLANYKISVPEELVRRAATAFSGSRVVASATTAARTEQGEEEGEEDEQQRSKPEGKSREMALELSRRQHMSNILHLLLARGADPNASAVPFPALFFAVKSGDAEMVRALLRRGADVSARLQEGRGGLTALHIAAALPGEAGVTITELLLHSLAFPDARAIQDEAFLDRTLEEDWARDEVAPEQMALLGGRTPLHIAASREDDYKRSHRIVQLLLQHNAIPHLACNGNTALTLAIQSGNDMAVDELLRYKANVNQALSHGIGSALCQASSIAHESKRSLKARIDLVDKFIDNGADILQPIAVGAKRQHGTAVDFAWQMYNLDKRVAFTPYHALSPAERQAFQDRNILLKHLGNRLRERAVERERLRLEAEENDGVQSRGPSENFVYTGAGASPPPTGDSGAAFLRQQEVIIRRPIFKYCYDCGRSVGVRLTPCTRCKEVYFCSKACKLRAWNDRHKDECQRIGGGAGPRRNDTRVDSPTPATDADGGLKKPTVSNLGRRLADLRLKNPMKGRSRSAAPSDQQFRQQLQQQQQQLQKQQQQQQQQQQGRGKAGRLPPLQAGRDQDASANQGAAGAAGGAGVVLGGRRGRIGGSASAAIGGGAAKLNWAGKQSWLPSNASLQLVNGRYVPLDASGRPLDLMVADNYSFV